MADEESELVQLNGGDTLIVSFGGMDLQLGGVLPFEFHRHLTDVYKQGVDMIFYVDYNARCYHAGLRGMTNTIEETVAHINGRLAEKPYRRIIFIGVSSGGYAAILFGSLCAGVTHVVAFIPHTVLRHPYFTRYTNLREVVNSTTKYILYGDVDVPKTEFHHNIAHCENLASFRNVRIMKYHCHQSFTMKHLRDTGEIKRILDECMA